MKFFIYFLFKYSNFIILIVCYYLRVCVTEQKESQSIRIFVLKIPILFCWLFATIDEFVWRSKKKASGFEFLLNK